MRRNPTKRIEQYRFTAFEADKCSMPLATTAEDGPNGVFHLPHRGAVLRVIASDGLGWEHVSVSLQARTPTWAEMDLVKRIFWRDDETVMQLHVPRSDHVNLAKNALHLWKPVDAEIPRPPVELVGGGKGGEG